MYIVLNPSLTSVDRVDYNGPLKAGQNSRELPSLSSGSEMNDQNAATRPG